MTQTRDLLIAFFKSLRVHLNTFLRRLSLLFEFFSDKLDEMNYKPIKNLSLFQFEKGAQELDRFIDVVQTFSFQGEKDGFQFVLMLQPVRALNNFKQSEFPISRYEQKLRLLYQNHLLPKLRKMKKEGSLKFFDLNEELTDRLIKAHCFIDFCHLDDRGYQMMAEEATLYLRKGKLLPAKK